MDLLKYHCLPNLVLCHPFRRYSISYPESHVSNKNIQHVLNLIEFKENLIYTKSATFYNDMNVFLPSDALHYILRFEDILSLLEKEPFVVELLLSQGRLVHLHI